MSFYAIIVVLVLFALPLVPLVWIARPSMAARGPAAAFGAAIVGIAVFQTGIFAPTSTAHTNVAHLVPKESARERCQEVLELVTEAGVVLDSTQANKLVVRNEGWQQLPPALRDAITDCAAQLSSGGSEGGAIEVILR